MRKFKIALAKHLLDERIRFFAKPLYELTINIELIVSRLFEYFIFEQQEYNQLIVNQNLTAVIKTFERPKVLRRLLNSIKRKYPGMHIIVVDDSRYPTPLDKVELITMPYDSGVSAGRNEGLKHVTTKYVLIMDDDFIFNRHTRFEAALTIMEANPEIDIMGGKVVNLPFFSTVDYSKPSLWPTSAKSTMPLGSYINGLPVYNKVANFFIGRTDKIRLVGWKPVIKRIDHADFFTRAKGILTTVFNPYFECLHARTPFNKSYMKKRMDIKDDCKFLNAYYRPLNKNPIK